ncbi:unnamed protein product [Rotaria socialis]|uniref:Reverse transcriptase domain-containing protein n=1 Tax=Rotaria socialis TaxID=392032 RepID=A0A817K2G2_9BILA|nr:unnamed protein product [Rotaria socialis]CAF3184338.1 unnamed protein product [Rotaria socialis]CAF4288378.1 unnamed protein product [Rotaria socialis]CAF4428779.1 unnamed protein product [Rotaria socialis]
MENFSQASSIDNKAFDDEVIEQSTFNRPIMMPPTMDRNVTPPDFYINNSCMSPSSVKTQPCAVQPSTLFDDNTHEKGEFSVNKTKAMNDKQEDEEQQQQDNDDDDDDDNDSTWVLYKDDDGEDQDNQLTYHHTEPQKLKDLDWKDLPNFIHNMDYDHLNSHERKRARFENQTLLSIRRKTIAANAIVRLPYKGSSFYICSQNSFQQKIDDYMARTGAYKLIHQLNGVNQNASKKCLIDIVERVEIKLHNLLRSKSIGKRQYLAMTIDRSSLRLNYLYFVPETHKEDIPVQPIMVCNDGPTMAIARYITPLLWSIFDRATNCIRFSNGAIDVVHAIERYAQNGHLKPSALFVTFNMDNLTTIFSHDETIAALKSLLSDQLKDQMIQGITVDTIIQLVYIVLQNQFCVSNNKLYQQFKGGASGLPLTMLLTYINMFYGQHRDLVKSFVEKNELFGRYQDQALLTWHGSEDEFRTLFNTGTDTEHTENLVTMSIGSTVHFHDLEIGHNSKGVLESKVYYDRDIDTLPNVSDESMENMSKELHAVLYRAVRCCSDLEKFRWERSHIDVAFLLSGLPPKSIDSIIQNFYVEYGLLTRCFSYCLQDDEYRQLRRNIIQDVDRQAELKKQRERQRHNTLFLPCPQFNDQETLASYKQRLKVWWKKYYGNEQQTKYIQIKWVKRTLIPIATSDILANKRPPIRLLTL